MALSIRETFGGLEHLRIAGFRHVLKRKPDHFMKRFERQAVPVEICLDPSGKQLCCELCGYVLVKAKFDNGWQMEMCSGLPIVDLDRPAFRKWLSSLGGTGSASGGNSVNDCQVRNFEPILHD